MNILVLAFAIMFVAACEGSSAQPDNGDKGEKGDVGPQGPAGPQGPVGPAGSMGSQGPQGLQGPAGPQGLQGAQGSVGPVGATGPQGSAGPIGPQGIQGPVGATGSVGPVGPRGLQGVPGTPAVQAVVYSANDSRLGLLMSATPGTQAYVAWGDDYTLVPDGYLVSLQPGQIWYANNDCTGAAYIDHGTYTQFGNRAFQGRSNALLTAPTSTAVNTAVGSYSMGSGACVVSSQGISAHGMVAVGSPISLAASLPWHVVIE